MLIDLITKDPDRQRTSLPGIPELADSINEVGLINPITVTPEGVLIAGERRLEACKLLGWTDIPTHEVESEDDLKYYVMELEENVKREPLHWIDYVQAVGRYQEQTGKSATKVAQDLSSSSSSISRLLLVYKHLEEVKEGADSHMAAYNIISRKLERKRDAVAEEIEVDTHFPTVGSYPPSTDLPQIDIQLDPPPEKPFEAPILNQDFTIWAPLYEGQKFNLFHLDLPYGINIDKSPVAATARDSVYPDSKETYYRLLAAFCENSHRLRAPTAHMIFWFSMTYYIPTKNVLEAAGWWVHEHPIIWNKIDGSGLVPDPARTLRRNYETAFFCTFGDRKITQTGNLLIAAAGDKTYHPSQKPFWLLNSLLKPLVDETTVFLDPTCGSASSLAAVHRLAPEAKVLGLEIDPEFYSRGVTFYQKNRNLTV